MKLVQKLTLIVLGLSLLPLSGCNFWPFSIETSSTYYYAEPEVSVAPHTPDSLSNYRMARDYAAAGRYELAREHYLLALAAADSRDMQNALVRELSSVDMMIKSLR